MRTIAIVIATSLLVTAVPAQAGLGQVGEDTYECTVTVGGGQTPSPAPHVGVDSDQVSTDAPQKAAVGGCQLKGSLNDSGVVTELDTADGCSAYADLDPNQPGAEAELKPGMPVKEGTALWAYCDAGVTNATNSVTIDFSASGR